VLCRPGRAPVLLEEGGLALGIEKSVRYCEVELALEEGDVLLFYTDGLTEAAPPDGSLVDLEPFLELLPCLLPRSAAEIAAGIEARLLEIAVPRDDLTLIVLKKIPGGEDSL
jgi:sigma-B regulation protein RsbU (phosphoserine phosphatase)